MKRLSFPVLIFVTIVLVSALIYSPPRTARAGTVDRWNLVRDVWGGAAVWDGSSIWQFGGYPSGRGREIFRYDFDHRALESIATKLPWDSSFPSAVWDGNYAYIVSSSRETVESEAQNLRAGTYLNTAIWRFDPVDRTITTVGQFDLGSGGAGAVWTGQYIYIVGGLGSSGSIHRFDPATGEIVRMKTIIDRSFAAVAYDGQYIRVIAGEDSAGQHHDTNFRYDPVKDELTIMPSPHYWKATAMTGVFDGTNILIFGGYVSKPFRFNSEIFKYEIARDRFVVMDSSLPIEWTDRSEGRQYPMAVWAGTRAFIVGGNYVEHYDGWVDEYRWVPYSDVVEYKPLPGPPERPQTKPGPGVGQITLSWWLPRVDSYSPPITSYNVWQVDGNVETLLTSTSTPSFVASGIPTGETRTYRISAVNISGEGPRTAPLTGSPPIQPDPPYGLSAGPGPGAGQITLSWTPGYNHGNAIAYYNVYAGSVSAEKVLIAQVTKTSFVESGLAKGTQRYYQVSAVNGVGEGARSIEQSATAPVEPGAPTDLRALPGNGMVQLQWTPPTDNGGAKIVNYRIYRGTASGAETYYGTSNGPAFNDRYCPFLVLCYYKVAAFNGVGEGPLSKEVFMVGSKI